jgi:hypothetical protein
MRLALILLSILPVLVEPAFATPVIRLQGNTDISKRNECEFADDKVVLTIMDNGKRLATKTYCTSFGDSKAKLVTDTRGTIYLLLEYRTGRTSEGTDDYLEVDWLDKQLKQVFQMQTVGITGPNAAYWYTHAVQTPKAGGLILTFTLHASPNPECCVPTQKKRVVKIDVP